MDSKINLDDLIEKLNMQPHEEGGLFAVTHYKDDSGNRPKSGSIYYYVYKDIVSAFHEIDCDEYWCYNAGSTAELWVITPDGKLEVIKVGIDDGAEPTVFVKKGSIFGARHEKGTQDGTLFTCVTVPRYLEGSSLKLFSKEEMILRFPQTKAFWE